MTETPAHHTTYRRVLLACAVLATAILSGFLACYYRPAPDAAATAPWSTMCQGRGGDSLHRLLGKGPTVTEVWRDAASSSMANADQSCDVSVGQAFVDISASRLDPGDYTDPEKKLALAEPHGRRFAAGDGGKVSSGGATALLTCRAPGSAAFHAEIVIRLDGTAAHNPDRVRLMESVARTWATDLESRKNCGMPN